MSGFSTLGEGGTWVNWVNFCWAGMCRWPLRAPTPLYSIMWPIIDPILVTFGKICNFRDPNLVTYHFYELTHFLD